MVTGVSAAGTGSAAAEGGGGRRAGGGHGFGAALQGAGGAGEQQVL